MVGMMVGWMRDEDFRWTELRQNSDQIAQNLFPAIERSRPERVRVRHGRSARQPAVKRRLVVPVTGPDGKRSKIGIAKKNQFSTRETQNLCGRNRLIMPNHA